MTLAAIKRSKLSPLDEWPSLKITVELLPWHWRILPEFYADDVDGWFGLSSISWLFLRVEWMANRPPFTVPVKRDGNRLWIWEYPT